MNLSYELCDELRKAGFPQRDWGDVYSCEEGHQLMMIPQRLRPGPAGIDIGKTITCPTLSELIEACGKNLEALVRGRGQKLWTAVGFDDRNPVGAKIIDVEADYPEQAVKNLWIALNKPK